MGDDGELLRKFAEEGATEAFAELVRRKVDLVHAAAYRKVGGDAHLAADVTQAVFLQLARKARHLAGHPSLSGWLYTTTWNCAGAMLRTQRRWRAREKEANTMLIETHRDPAPDDWQALGPVLEDAMHELSTADREAILLRYFENHTFGEIGARLGLAENTARMRVDRALEKLRGRLLTRGITSTALALGTALTAQAVAPAPANLAMSAAVLAIAEGAGQGVPAAAAISRWFSLQSVASTGLVSLIGLGAFILSERRLDERFAREEQDSQQALVGVRVESRRLGRIEQNASFDGAATPQAESLARTRWVMELVESGLLGRFVWPNPPADSYERGIRSFARVLGMSDDETQALVDVAENGYAHFVAAVRAEASVQRNGSELAIGLAESRHVRAAYENLQRDLARALGTERFECYRALGAQGTFAKLFAKWGLEPVTIRIRKRFDAATQTHGYHTSQVGFERGLPGEEREALRQRLGPVGAFLPADF